MLNNKYIFAKDEQGAYHLLYALENYERDDQTYGHVREFINGVENAGYWWDVDGQDESWGHFVNWHSSMPDIEGYFNGVISPTFYKLLIKNEVCYEIKELIVIFATEEGFDFTLDTIKLASPKGVSTEKIANQTLAESLVSVEGHLISCSNAAKREPLVL